MAETVIAGIMRAGIFSPNHIGNDAAIFNIVADQLRKRGCVVNVYSEEQFIANGVEEKVVVNMCRERESIQRLQSMEDRGALVINSGYGIENCIRERQARIFQGVGIPYPKSLIVNTNESVIADLEKASISQCWIKRGDFYTLHREDVSYVRHAQEAQDVLHEYFLRGISRAVICQHLEGDLVKFYGIKDSPFFYWLYPLNGGQSRYGRPDSASGHSPRFDKDVLKAICQKAAEVLDVQIYGGDCIVSADGDIQIIDFNDWPSFAPCRQEAGPQIARKITGMIKERRSSLRI